MVMAVIDVAWGCFNKVVLRLPRDEDNDNARDEWLVIKEDEDVVENPNALEVEEIAMNKAAAWLIFMFNIQVQEKLRYLSFFFLGREGSPDNDVSNDGMGGIGCAPLEKLITIVVSSKDRAREIDTNQQQSRTVSKREYKRYSRWQFISCLFVVHHTMHAAWCVPYQRT